MHTAPFLTRRVLTSCSTLVSEVSLTIEIAHNCCTERLLGGLKVFLLYAHDYVTTFSGKSIDTWEWKDHLYSYFRKNGGDEKLKLLDTVDWDVSH